MERPTWACRAHRYWDQNLPSMDSRAAATSPVRNGPGRTKAAVTTKWSTGPSAAK